MIVHQSLAKTMAIEAWSFFGARTLPRKTFVGSVATFFSPLSPAVLPVAVTQSHQSRFKAIQAFGTPSRGGYVVATAKAPVRKMVAVHKDPLPAFASLPPVPYVFHGGWSYRMVAICGTSVTASRG